MNPLQDYIRYETRRQFLTRGKNALGTAAMAALLAPAARGASVNSGVRGASGGLPSLPHFAPRAKNVIYLHMVGGPSQYKFAQHGKSGMWVSELLPYTAQMVDDMCLIRSMHTEAINHEPAICAMQTGNQITGRPCIGSWVSYGLGSLNNSLPTFVVLVAKPSNTEQIQAISARLWSSGYLSGEHAGVAFRSSGDPILHINNPPGVPTEVRRRGLDALRSLNEMNYNLVGDPETHTRIQQYELAFRMQASVPDLTQ